MQKIIVNLAGTNLPQTFFDFSKPAGATLYTVLIVVFTFFYAFVQVNPEKVAENLQKSSGYILSVRPGKRYRNNSFQVTFYYD